MLSDKYFETMDSWQMETVLELAAVVFTVMQFLSGITICMTIRRKRDTNETSAFPFLAGLISCSLWLKYGILQRDSTLMIVNSIGLTLQILYVIFYYWHSSVKTQIKRQLLLTISILFSILIYLKFFTTDLLIASQTCGLLACGAGLIFCASPLASLAAVCKNKSTESLPFSLILSTFIVTSLWFLYGVVHSDYFIQIPNLLGACISAFQLFLFVIFPSSKTYPFTSSKE